MVIVCFGLVIVRLSGDPFPYTITVNGETWTVHRSEAVRTFSTSGIGLAEGIISYYTILFPHDSVDRVIELDFVVLEGALDLLIFPGLDGFESYRYGGMVDDAFYQSFNSTTIDVNIDIEYRYVVISTVGHSDNVFYTGTLKARCVLE
jgi:hypothetical protein